MTNSSMTDEAVLSDVANACRSVCRKRQSPSGSGSGGLHETPRNGMRKYCRHETLTLRALMAGKEVGTIIGRHGENIKTLRAQTGACVKITDGSSPERIITVSGSVQQVTEAFECICQTFEDDYLRSTARLVENNLIAESPCPPITLRLLIPEHHCGSIIGKGGTKIRRIREVTGAHIQVAAQVLPNSSDRPITLSGSARAVALSISKLCQIFVRLCFQNIGVPYQPQPTFGVPPASRLVYQQDPVLCDHLSGSSLPAISQEPVVFPATPDILFSGSPTFNPSSYLDYAATFPIVSPTRLLYSPESVLSVPLFVPTIIPTANPTAASSLTYFPIPIPYQGTFEPQKTYPLSQTNSAFMSNLQGSIYSNTNTLPQTDSPHLSLSHPVVPRLELPPETRQSGLVQGTNLISNDQSLRPCDSLAERPPLVRELEQLINCSTGSTFTAARTPDRMQADTKATVATDRAYQTLLSTTQSSQLSTDQKIGLALHQLVASPCVRTPDPLLNVPCPKTPNVRHITQESQHKVEMFLPNDIVGCIIGRGGNKINEIRQTSQATIKISSGEDGMAERRITITGTATAIKTAQAMINNSLLSREFMNVTENESEAAVV